MIALPGALVEIFTNTGSYNSAAAESESVNNNDDNDNNNNTFPQPTMPLSRAGLSRSQDHQHNTLHQDPLASALLLCPCSLSEADMELSFLPFLPLETAFIFFTALRMVFSRRLKRSAWESSRSGSSGHCAAGEVEPPKRRMESKFVGWRVAGSSTWIPPGKPTSPSPNSRRAASCSDSMNRWNRRTRMEGIVSTMISIRLIRALPTMLP
mmetsp:Transcript_54377/g.98061  ORF Transcript_54377/g.98061 Transcript_54377/m.98061 type:complete len:210 (-) Transcript_54377:201-830(-)